MNKSTIMVIDDQLNIRREVVDMLKETYSVKVFSSADEALDFLREENQIGLIFLDVYMPNMPSSEFLSELSKDRVLRDVPVVILTTETNQEKLTPIMEMFNVVEWLPKPIIPANLYACVEKHLENVPMRLRQPQDKIIIIDGDSENLETAKNALCTDYVVQTATSGSELFKLLENTIPDIILLNIQMPDMDGHEIAKSLKDTDETKHIPVIFLASEYNPDDELRALRAGAGSYLAKPLNKDILKISVENYLLLRNKKDEWKRIAKKAKAANIFAIQYIGDIGHDMKTPLNGIMHYVNEALNSPVTELIANIKKIEASGNALKDLSNDLMTISIIETEKIELKSENYEMAKLIECVAIQCFAQKKDAVTFSIVLDENLPAQLSGDKRKVKRILTNILSNAFKYTSNGSVSLSVMCTSEVNGLTLKATVSDTGKGIKAEDLPRVFSRGVRVKMSDGQKIEGTGRGLTIAKGFAQMMNGDIEAESEYGKGSTFTMHIKQQFAALETHENYERVSDEDRELLENFQNDGDKIKQRPLALPQYENISYARILVVDDEEINRDVLVAQLEHYKIKVDVAESGQGAIGKVNTDGVHYNAIFMDNQMLGMDGFETLREIRAIGTDYAKDVPIIAYTGEVVDSDEEIFLTEGFTSVLAKPSDVWRLYDILVEFVKKKTAR